MAKYGEGDKRWIVEERTDGTNVHNWHWAETDCLEWSRNLLTKLLSDQIILNGEGDLFIKIKKVEKVDGEAYVNIRKGKIIPGYEISVSISWEGEATDVEGKSLLKADGNVEIPYIADENADEDPEIRVTVKDEGPIGKRLKEAFLAKGKPFVLDQIRVYVSAMAKGGPAKEDLEVKKPNSTPKKVLPVAGTAAPAPAVVEEKKEKRKEGFKTITMTEKFSCRAKDMFEILMDENRWKGFTQSNARISKEVGGEFSIFDGSVTGTNVELQEGKLIVQKWRFGSWPDGIHSMVKILTFFFPFFCTNLWTLSNCLLKANIIAVCSAKMPSGMRLYSRLAMTDGYRTGVYAYTYMLKVRMDVRLTLDEPEPGVTSIKLTHTDVPEEDRYGNATVVDNTERGWRDLIFNKIRAVFGFGI
ncbi:unnamed protein product [Ilex paraguariensis]|uniref:Activator of Hsp90 ATPase AHSA1-like N-terminal domain-containing protein n=1 Tax=Ilex paraguariensis TaxID=185542 RepID=A0ABC8RV89_9AQUA